MFDTATQFIDAGSVASTANSLVTLPAGAMVLTLRGECAARDLAAGDRIITRDSGAITLRALVEGEASFAAIRIKAGSLGHTRPESDMRLAPDTLVHIRDWRAPALCKTPVADLPASGLVDGEFVAVEETASHEIVTLAFDRDHIIYADGLEIRARAA
jgi:Hint domain